MKKLLFAALAALLAPLFVVTTSSPVSATPQCHWVDKGDLVHAMKICKTVTSFRPTSQVIFGATFFQPRYTVNPSLEINLELRDLDNDGDCTWVKLVKTGNLPFTETLAKVCGQGLKKNVNVYYGNDILIRIAPGAFRLEQCEPAPEGCKTFWKQKVN